MRNNESDKEYLRFKLTQAREALDEARALFDEGAELNFVMNSLYYAFLYPVLGLLRTRRITAPMQSTAISLFEREFIRTGMFEKRILDALQRAFELRPACDCEGQKTIAKTDIEQLLLIAEEFLKNVARGVT